MQGPNTEAKNKVSNEKAEVRNRNNVEESGNKKKHKYGKRGNGTEQNGKLRRRAGEEKVSSHTREEVDDNNTREDENSKIKQMEITQMQTMTRRSS